ncbi:MAG: pyridoxal-phosphate dependent enzyme, partial [Acidilobaceae archaeon]
MLVCDSCGRAFATFERRILCDCGGLLHVELGRVNVDWETLKSRRFRFWRYKEMVPLPPGAPIVSLDEGGTPLVYAGGLSGEMKVKVMVKLEGSNPTGSFKDRGMTVATSIARFHEAKALISASTGNTAASMSAYARRAGMVPVVLIPSGKIAEGKLSQLKLYGAVVVEVEGGFDEAMKTVLEYSVRGGDAYVVNSINPWRVEGQKTLAFEIAEEMGVPDWVIVPVGNGG